MCIRDRSKKHWLAQQKKRIAEGEGKKAGSDLPNASSGSQAGPTLIAGMTTDGNWSAPPVSLQTAGILPPLPLLENMAAATAASSSSGAAVFETSTALAIVNTSDRMRSAEASEHYQELVAKTRRLNPSNEKQRLESAIYQLMMNTRKAEEATGFIEESCVSRIQEQQAACNAMLKYQADRFGEAAEIFRHDARQQAEQDRLAAEAAADQERVRTEELINDLRMNLAAAQGDHDRFRFELAEAHSVQTRMREQLAHEYSAFQREEARLNDHAAALALSLIHISEPTRPY